MKNLISHKYTITGKNRSDQKGHKPMVIWFSGLSGSGKSSIASGLEKMLHSKGFHTFCLDGDNIRLGLNKDLGFSQEERSENIRRIAEVAKLFNEAGILVLAAFITPLEKDRKTIRQIVGKQNLIEIFIDTPLEECEKRDVKGLYRKVREGKIKEFSGISSPFEIPKNPDLSIKTQNISVKEAVNEVVSFLGSIIDINE